MRNKIIFVMLLLFVQLAFAAVHTNVQVTKVSVTRGPTQLDVNMVPSDPHIHMPDGMIEVPNLKLFPVNSTIHFFNFSDNDSIPVLQVDIGPTTPVANKKFSIVVSATDDNGLAALRLLLSDGWHSYPCSDQLSCQKEFFTSEQNLGTYNYKAMAVDNAQKVAVGSMIIVLDQNCSENWVKNNNSCLAIDQTLVSYNDTTGCLVPRNRPADDGTFASCDYCTPDIFQSQESNCSTNDTKTVTQADLNECYSKTGLDSDKVEGPATVSCDYCTPIIVEHSGLCSPGDEYRIEYSDSNGCFLQTGLNSDKVPADHYSSCDYCTPNWQPQNTTCINGNMTKYYVDANGCFDQTHLASDNNKPANETSTCSVPGHLEPYLVLPNQTILVSGTTLVNQSRNVTVRTGVRCVGGPCKNVTAALDPEARVDLPKINTSVIILSANLIKNVREKPRTVIIEFKESGGLMLNDTLQRSMVKNNQERTIRMLNRDGPDFKVTYKYMLVNAMAGEINSKGLETLLKDPSVAAIYEDFVGQASVAQGKESLGLDDLNNFTINGKNLTGKNYSICLIDSGVNYNHESLGGGGYPNSKVIGGWNFVHNISDVYDLNGHGTKMSGILAGNGTVRGVAPDATLVEAVVLNETNWYVGSKAYAAMDWCYANRANYSIAAVSMSFGDSIMNNLSTCPSYFNAPLRNMNLAGIILAAASGNEWFNQGIAYPACSPYVIGVGSMDDGRYFGTELNNTITNFTNIGFGMNLLMAPGRGIGTSDRDTGTSSCTGTSCSTPFIAAGGLLLNQYLVEKYNRTINNPKMFGLLNSTGRQVPMEDKARYNGTFTLPYFDEALNRFETPQHKGLVSMLNTSKPFYTLQQNPVACGDMAENQTCESQWNVTATGIVGTYEFYTIYASANSTANTTKFNVTII